MQGLSKEEPPESTFVSRERQQNQDGTGGEQQQNRSCSAPPKFDSQSLFLYQENDHFIQNFNKGFLPLRMDENYNEFYTYLQSQKEEVKQEEGVGEKKASHKQKMLFERGKSSPKVRSPRPNDVPASSLPKPITALDEEELLQTIKQEAKAETAKDTKNTPSPAQTAQKLITGMKNLAASPQSQSPGLGQTSQQNNNTHSKSSGGKQQLKVDIIKRRHRLSTISSDFFDDDSPRASFRQRRKSSNFDMLTDPFKYQDIVNKFLDGIDEEDVIGVRSHNPRKRTRSSTYLKQNPPHYLPEIDEETYEQEIITYGRQTSSNFIKDQIQSYKFSTETTQSLKKEEAKVPRDPQLEKEEKKEGFQKEQRPSFEDEMIRMSESLTQMALAQIGLQKSPSKLSQNQQIFHPKLGLQKNDSLSNAQKSPENMYKSPPKQDFSNQSTPQRKGPPQQQQQVYPQQTSTPIRQVHIQKQFSASPSKPPLEMLSVAQIAKKFNLLSTFETLEGHENLNENEIRALLEYSSILARDQGGCRFLQKKIDEGIPDYTERIFNSTIEYYMELMNDPFGNYLTQKITESCKEHQLTEIVKKVEIDPVSLCRNSHGTRSIQKIIETVKKPYQIELLSSFLKDKVQELAEDINGNHVIQKILFTWKPQHNQFIYEAMMAKCVQIACHKHGCCVMQKCIDGADSTQKLQLTLKIADFTQTFVRNPYGNYVVQYVLELKMMEVNQRIGEKLLGSLLELGKQKFSSNVIEKCLEHNFSDIKQSMVKEILSANSFYDFLLDQYGNYVIQKSLSVAVEPQFSQFIEKLRPDMELLRQSNEFGIKIYNRLIKQYPALSIDGTGRPYKADYSKKSYGKESGASKQGGSKGQKGKKPKKDKIQKPIGGQDLGYPPQSSYNKSQNYMDPGMYQDMYYQGNMNAPKQVNGNNVNISININANFGSPPKSNDFYYKPSSQTHHQPTYYQQPGAGYEDHQYYPQHQQDTGFQNQFSSHQPQFGYGSKQQPRRGRPQ